MKEHIVAVHNMQKYIEEHYNEPISMQQLADVACYSKWHTSRIFYKYLKVTPSKYIRMLRLSKSALEISRGQLKITEIAFLCGFNSVDGYRRAFYKEFGCNPKDYATNPVSFDLFKPIKIDDYKEKNNMKKSQIFVSLVLCFVLGFGGGLIMKDDFITNQPTLNTAYAYSSKEVKAAVNSTINKLGATDSITTQTPDDKVLLKNNQDGLNKLIKQEDSNIAFLEHAGSILSYENTSIEMKNISQPVFSLINKLFEAGAYDLMSKTLTFEVNDPEMQPSNFTLKIKMVGYQDGIGLEYSIQTEYSFSYTATYIALDANKNVKNITTLFLSEDTTLYGIYDVAANKTFTLNPNYIGFDSALNELNNMANVMKYTTGSLNTTIDIAQIMKDIQAQ